LPDAYFSLGLLSGLCFFLKMQFESSFHNARTSG
jgi:hypothetical protein